MSLKKVSYEAFCISGKNEATDLAVSQLWGSAISIISAQVTGPQMWAASTWVLSRAQVQVLQNRNMDGRDRSIYNRVVVQPPVFVTQWLALTATLKRK